MYPCAFEYVDATSVEQALDHLQRYEEGDAKVLAGGQSLIPLMRLRFAQPACLVDLNRISALDHLTFEDGWLRIGAIARERDVETSPEVQRAFPILRDTARVIADPIVRNLATIGGNLAHGDPANDHPATMVALGAEVVAQGPEGQRVIPVEEFFLGLYETALGPTELLTEIRIPPLPAGAGAAYLKFERQVSDFAIAGVAARITVEDGSVGAARLVYTNVGPTPERVEAAERVLVGQAAAEASFRAAAEAAAGALDLDDDLRGTAGYKRRVVRALTERALRLARARATGQEA